MTTIERLMAAFGVVALIATVALASNRAAVLGFLG